MDATRSHRVVRQSLPSVKSSVAYDWYKDLRRLDGTPLSGVRTTAHAVLGVVAATNAQQCTAKHPCSPPALLLLTGSRWHWWRCPHVPWRGVRRAQLDLAANTAGGWQCCRQQPLARCVDVTRNCELVSSLSHLLLMPTLTQCGRCMCGHFELQTLALAGTAGLVVPIAGGGSGAAGSPWNTALPDRFTLGGTRSLRGFADSGVGPRASAVSTFTMAPPRHLVLALIACCLCGVVLGWAPQACLPRHHGSPTSLH